MKEFSFYDVTISEVVLKGEGIFAKTRLQAVEKLISTVNESHDFTFDLGNPGILKFTATIDHKATDDWNARKENDKDI